MDDALASRVAAVAALDEPTRARLYAYVVRQSAPVGRDEVAAALRIPRATVAFHLDKLVAADLLAVDFERRSGRAGPGAGRPAKLYRRSARRVAVSVPARSFELAGHLMAAALATPDSSLAEQAKAAGAELGTRGELRAVLAEQGFEPDERAGEVVLRNCPFRELAERHPDLVCGMALGLVEGMLAGTGEAGWRAERSLGPGRCCVRLVS